MLKRPNTVRASYEQRPINFWRPRSEPGPGRAGDVIRSMRAMRVPAAPVRVWTPPTEYLYIAKHMPESEAAAFVARCEAWFEARAALARPEPKPEPPALRLEPMLELMAKYKCQRPPLKEMCKTMLACGHTEERVQKYIDWHNKMEATSDERQAALDAVFAKYPSANKGVPKKKKIIKAVKKMTNNES